MDAVYYRILMGVCTFFYGVIFTQAAVTTEELHKLFSQSEKVFFSLVKNPHLHTLQFNPLVDGKDVWLQQEALQASYGQYTDVQNVTHHSVFVFGGLVRMPEMTVDNLALTICHEFGHGLAGPPYKVGPLSENSSVEGQADYYSTQQCLRLMFSEIPDQMPGKSPSDPVAQTLCEKDDFLCLRTLRALEVELAFFRRNPTIEDDVSFAKKDTSVVDSVDHNPWFRPAGQCRFDTLLSGWFNRPRPSCWFIEE